MEKGREEGIEEGREEGREQGEIRARQNTLLRLLRKRSGEVPERIAEKIEATSEREKLDAWLDRILTATTVDEMGI